MGAEMGKVTRGDRADAAAADIVRSAVDGWRLIGFLVVGVVGLLLATVGRRTLSGFVGDLVDALADVPTVLITPVVLISQVALFTLTLVAPVVLIFRGRGRVAGLGAIAIALAVVAMAALQLVLPAAEPSASLPVDSIAFDSISRDSVAAVRSAGFPASVTISGYAAAAVVVNTELSARWSRLVWGFLGFLTLLRFATSRTVPIDVVLAIGLGGAVGSLLMVACGRSIASIPLSAVAEALQRSEVDLTGISRLDDPAWPEWHLLIRTGDDRHLIARTVGLHEFRSDSLHRTYRRARLKDVGDDDSYSSPRRALAVEAMMSLMAAEHGVRTPTVRVLEPVGPDEFVIALDHVEGRSMDTLDDAELSPDLLIDMWRQIDGLRRAGIAHRDLRLGRFLLDAQDRVWIREFAFGEPGAAAGSLDGDVAELLAGTYARVGPQRAVAAASQVLGPNVLAAALVRLVPVAMTRPTRAALKGTAGGLKPLIDEVRRSTGAPAPEFVAVERVKPRTLVLGAMLGVAVYVVLPQLANLPSMLETIGDADWQFVPGVVLGAIATYVGASLGLIGATPGRLPFGQTMLVGLASSFVALLAPSGVGRVGLSVRYLQKRGLSTSVGVSASAAREVASVVVHLLLIVVFALWAGQTDALGSEFDILPSTDTLLAIGGVILGVAGLVVAIPRVRKLIGERAIPAIRDAATAMRQVAASPVKMLSLLVGSALVPIGFIAALFFSVQAFGGGASFTAVGLVFLTVGALAAAAPTPGGIGAVEAVLLAALTGLGIAAPAALAAVFLYRIITFWLPLAPGAVVFQVLSRRDVI